MDRTYEYAVLTAIPNPRRGERVNIGLAVFRADGVDVRFKQAAYKLRAITGDDWEPRIESAQERLEMLAKESSTPAEILKEFDLIEPLLKPSALGWLTASSDEQYEERVGQILKSLVDLPKREMAEPTRTRINTEMAQAFAKARILARADETIDAGKVVRNFAIDESEGLKADFALKNGKLRVTSTLDLRKHTAYMGDAALKSIVLDKATKKFKEGVVTVGVYAVDAGMLDTFGAHIKLLGDYANELYDWYDRDSRRKFQESLYNALGRNPGDLFEEDVLGEPGDWAEPPAGLLGRPQEPV